MAVPTAGPGVTFTIENISPSDDATWELVSYVGRLTGTFNRRLTGTMIGIRDSGVFEEVVLSTPTKPVGNVITFNSEALHPNVSTDPTKAIGGAYEFVASLRVGGVGRLVGDLVNVSFGFIIDAQGGYNLVDGRIAFGDVATTGAGGIAPARSLVASAVDPTVADDSGSGYSIGSVWINTADDLAYTLVDATAGAAVWATAVGGADLSWDAATSTVASATGTDAALTAVDASNPGLMLSADKTKLDSVDVSAITANTAKTGISSGQASEITANTAKTGITGGQASEITANTAKVSYDDAALVATNTGNISTNATTVFNLGSDVSSNWARLNGHDTDISSIQSHQGTQDTAIVNNSTAIALNTAKTGISSGQASEIAANTAKTTYDDAALVATHTGEISALESGQATQDTAITANTAKTGITAGQASAIAANTAKTGISAGQASAITANTAKVTYDDAALVAGHTTDISTNVSAIALNTAKTGISAGQASAITANTAKTGISSGQASAITANTAKTGITAGQASAITANTAKVTYDDAALVATHTTDISTNVSAIALNTAKTGITGGQASAITANTAKVTYDDAALVAGHTTDIGTNTTKLAGIEAGADVTDTAAVTAAGSLMDSEVDANIKSLVLPASTTITAAAATVLDDASTAAMLTTLGAQAQSALLDATTASFTTAAETKLSGIEALADVTDSVNVEAAVAGAGTNSLAIGPSSSASATDSIAFGNTAAAAGLQSVSIGRDSDATATGGTAVGYLAQATGSLSLAAGRGAAASTSGAVSLGYASVADGTNAVSVGQSANAGGAQAVSVGRDSDSAGIQSAAVGFNSSAAATYSVSLGGGTTATATGATALGAFADATANNAVALGYDITGNIANTTSLNNLEVQGATITWGALTLSVDGSGFVKAT